MSGPVTEILTTLKTMSAALDDLSATVDDFQNRFTDIDMRLVALQDRVVDQTREIHELHDVARTAGRDIETIDSIVREMEPAIRDLSNDVPYMREIAEDLRRKELNEMRFDARAAMGKVAFVRVR